MTLIETLKDGLDPPPKTGSLISVCCKALHIMSNKKSPNLVISRFIEDMHRTKSDAITLDKKIEDERIEFRRRMQTNLFLTVATRWEMFLSEWFVAAINADPSKALEELEARLVQSASEMGIDRSLLATSMISVSHVNLEAVEGFLRVKGFNFTAPNLKELKSHAERWLADEYVGKIRAWTNYEYSPVLVTRLLRNALAHQSAYAYSVAASVLKEKWMHQELRLDPPKGFNRKSIQTYLYKPLASRTGADEIRLYVLINLLSDRAETLLVPS